MESFENRRRRFLWKDLISQRRYHAIPQQWFERPKKQKYFSCLKVCQRWCDERETRKISFMLWRCEKCGEFRLQQVEQSAQVFVFAEVTTTSQPRTDGIFSRKRLFQDPECWSGRS
ncbi:uncharacterized protein LOC141876389 isoform X2 [Acropora palmata]|uniref:uncharacterized protein LOC141876389 isoform X2 n=1 Tax=Acropora palmata TaxID=6131 RepID=UPI003DA12B6F